MSTQQEIQSFRKLLSALNDTPHHERVDFLAQGGIDTIADMLVEDGPTHLILLKRIVELLTLIPMEERYIIEEIATTANYKYTQHTYNQSRLFSSSDDVEQNSDDEFNFPAPA